MRLHPLLPIMLLSVAAQGCDVSGIHPLGSLRDVTSNCARSTWVRSTDEGTELFLFGVDDPSQPSPVDDVTGVAEESCFVHAFITHDTDTTLLQGTYVVDQAGVGEFTVDAEYTYIYEPTIGTLERHGSSRNDEPSPAMHPITLAASGDQLLVEYDGEGRRLTNLRDVIPRLDTTTQAGAEQIFALYNASLYTSFVRLLGFQAAGMTMYFDNTVVYQALVSSSFSVVVLGGVLSPHNILDYAGFSDLNGIVVTGRQDTYIDSPLQADGYMDGVLSFEMRGGPDSDETVIRGGVDYGDLIVDNGIGGGGFYTMPIEGRDDYVISWELGDEIDLRSILPVSEGQP